MSEGENNMILFAIEQLSKNNTENHNAIIKQITDSHKNTMLQVEAGLNANSISIAGLNKTICEHNSRLRKAEKRLDCGGDKIKKYDELLGNIRKNKYFILMGTILFAVIMNFLYDIGAITPILKRLLEKF